MAGGAVEEDLAAVGFDGVLDDAEADTDALGFAAEFGAEAIELFEDALVFGQGNAGAAVLDGDVDGAGVGCQAEGDEFAVG